MSTAPDDSVAIAERLGFPIPEPYQHGVSLAFARLLEQAALVMAADTQSEFDGDVDFKP